MKRKRKPLKKQEKEEEQAIKTAGFLLGVLSYKLIAEATGLDSEEVKN